MRFKLSHNRKWRSSSGEKGAKTYDREIRRKRHKYIERLLNMNQF